MVSYTTDVLGEDVLDGPGELSSFHIDHCAYQHHCCCLHQDHRFHNSFLVEFNYWLIKFYTK